MPIHRHFIDHPLSEGDRLPLSQEESRHLYKVVRARIGDTIELTNGRGELASASVVELEPSAAFVRIETVEKQKARRPRLILAQAVPRLPKLDLIVEKGTELGVDAFWLFPGEQSEKKRPLGPHPMQRLERIAIAALKQSGRLFLPEIEWVPPISEWSHLPNLSFYGALDAGAAPLLDQLPHSHHIEEIAVVIGPESGFTPSEAAALERLGARATSLHTNTLRTETASIAAFAIVGGFLDRLDREADRA